MITKQDAIIEVYKLIYNASPSSTSHVLFENELRRRFPRSVMTIARIAKLFSEVNEAKAVYEKNLIADKNYSWCYTRIATTRDEILDLIERLRWDHAYQRPSACSWAENVGA